MTQLIEGWNSICVKATLACLLLLLFSLAPNLLKAQSALGTDAPLPIRITVTDSVPFGVTFGLGITQEVDLTVTDKDDPGGHTNFVTPPPDALDFSLELGFLVAFVQKQGAANVPWLEVEPMVVDDNLEFIGESRATVAGFPNILTVISGSITSSGITGTFDIGAGGGLPGGDSIRYDFLLDAAIGLTVEIPLNSFLSINAEVGAVAVLTDVLEGERKPENFYLSINDSIQATEADWWLVLLQGGETLSFDLNTGTFVPGLRPTYQGPTIDVEEPVRFWSFPETPTGEVTLFFGIDTTQDGIVNESELIGTGFTYYFP